MPEHTVQDELDKEEGGLGGRARGNRSAGSAPLGGRRLNTPGIVSGTDPALGITEREGDSVVGRTLFDPSSGTYWTISFQGQQSQRDIRAGRPRQMIATSDSGEVQSFKGGQFYTGDGFDIRVDSRGFITGTPLKLTQTERKEVGLSPLSRDGGGDDGSSPGSPGQIILPDVIGTANAWLQYYEAQVRNGLMERTQAAEDWDRKFSELNSIIDVEISQATIDQNAAIGTNQATAAFDANTLRQQEEFGSRAGTFVRDFLPNFQPGLQGVSIPGVSVNGQVGGALPVPQVNADQIFGLGSLAGAGPTAPIPVPNPQITPFDPSQLPNVPGFTPPPIPNIPGLLNQGFGINI